MLFNSFQFLIFFPVVTIIYFLLPHKYRWLHLLLASCVFYAAFIPVYILILFVTIIVDYFAGIMIAKSSGRRRKWFLALSIVANVSILAFFKYYNFFIENINTVIHSLGMVTYDLPYLNIILPIGLSFHTFQAMSYTIEVYRGTQKPERHFGIYSLYVMFYPQLVAGPIERPNNLLHQFHEKKYFNNNAVVSGLRLMIWGLFKKVVIADRLAIVTDPVFNDPQQYQPVALAMATLFFCFQIFCDFSGYSDMAIGAARIMGFKLMTNFNRPYHARSISEFWSRWHISLSTWFKDYLYISLGGNRVSVPRWYFNLFFVFLVSGFWHGANWTFIIWGAIHGFYLIFALVTKKFREGFADVTGISKKPWLYNSLQTITTFFLVLLSWVFFRANSVDDALYILGQFPKIVLNLPQLVNFFQSLGPNFPMNPKEIATALSLIVFMEIIHQLQARRNVTVSFNRLPVFARWSFYYAAILAILFLGVFENREFIYFQF
jgi:D-alanyl-lipoteichoic acid acyltransferase DltB (MBOAT superfamily)